MRLKLTYTFSVLFLSILFIFSAFDVVHHWKIKENYEIKFTHVDAEGIFKKFEGEILFDERKPEEARFHVKVAVNSVESGNPARDESIASDSWLNAEKNPFITFLSKGASKVEGKWHTTGKFNANGVEKTLTIPFDFKTAADTAVFEGAFTLKMRDFHLSDEEEETIKIELKVPVKR